jgi:hypothetical protein
MSTASIDPRVLRTAKWFANKGWTINVNHGDGVVEAAMPCRNGESPVVINVIAVVAAATGT